jgi:PAS domain S-box-containing protein
MNTEMQFRLAMEAIRDYAIVMLDSDGRVVSWNPGAERILGYPGAEILGRHYSTFCPGCAGEGGRPEPEGWMIRRDGSSLWADCVMTPIAGPGGDVEGHCLIVRDRSAQKASEEQLEAATQRAEAANRAKSEFLAVISHEIRTPMNAILGMADLLHESPLNEDQRKYVEVFRRAGNNLLGLINDLLDLTKIESGHLELDRIDFDLLDVADQTTELVLQRARSKGIGLDVHLPEGKTALRGDPARLRQILLNLLGNAVKFTDRGKVTLTVSAHPSGKPGHFCFSIADTGIGIAPDKVETIFDDFSQADNSISRKYGGTGLGLGISRRLARLMGGELTVTSRPGEGSTFRFEAQFEPLAGSEVQPFPEAAELKGLPMMIVDRDPGNRALLRQMLAGWGVRADEFASGAEALVALAGTRYTLAFVRGQMRGMDGGSLAVELGVAAPDLSVILHESDQRLAETARDACLPLRPVRRAEFLQAVRKALATPPRRERARAPYRPPVPSAPVTRNGGVRPGGLRILIAEDSDDNRLLMEFYLRETPHQIELAADGKEALDLFQARPFDLVLMDLQMPVMDGLTATRCIRSLESDRHMKRTPILAFTANAHEPDLHRSLVAGCNAHITKPISKPALLAAVEHYGSAHAGDAGGGKAVPKEVRALIPSYLSARRRDLERLAKALEARDFGQIRQIVHDIKGTGGAYGFPKLTELGAAMQASAEVSDPAALESQFAELADYLWRSPA